MRTRRIPTLLGHIQVHLVGNISQTNPNPALVCWPSLLMTGSMWKAQVDHFGRDHLLVLIDPPGHGGSDLLSRRFTLEECALCLKQLLGALELRECVVLGNSWGGMMGGVFAALYPELTRGAVLMNCTASAASLRQKIEYTGLVALARHLYTLPRPLTMRATRAFAGLTTEQSNRPVMEWIRSSVAAVNPRSVGWAIDSVVPRRRDHHALLAAIRRPVLVIAGDEDRTFPVHETRAMADAIPGSIFKVLPQVGHLAAVEAPQQVNAAIAEFLGAMSQANGRAHVSA